MQSGNCAGTDRSDHRADDLLRDRVGKDSKDKHSNAQCEIGNFIRNLFRKVQGLRSLCPKPGFYRAGSKDKDHQPVRDFDVEVGDIFQNLKNRADVA